MSGSLLLRFERYLWAGNAPLGRECPSLSLPDKVPQTGAVKQHHILMRKSPWQDPGLGAVRAVPVRPTCAGTVLSWQPAPLMCLSWSLFQLLLRGACWDRAFQPGELWQPPPHQRSPQSSPGSGDPVTAPGAPCWDRGASETTRAPPSPGNEDLTQIPSTQCCLKDPTMLNTPAPLCLGSLKLEVPHYAPQGIFPQHRMIFPKQLF